MRSDAKATAFEVAVDGKTHADARGVRVIPRKALANVDSLPYGDAFIKYLAAVSAALKPEGLGNFSHSPRNGKMSLTCLNGVYAFGIESSNMHWPVLEDCH